MSKENNRRLAFPPSALGGQNVLWIAVVPLVYFVAARLSLMLKFQPEGIAAIWPPTGIFLSAILLSRRDIRPWLIGVLFLADFMAQCLAGTPILVSTIYSLSLTGDAVLGSWLLRRFVGESISFRRVWDLAGWLVLSVLLSNSLTSLAAAAAAELLPGTHSFWSTWQWSATSGGAGNLLVTPFILTWAAWARTGFRAKNWRRAFEGAVLIISLVLVSFALFRYLSGHRLFALFLPYVIFPFLLWAALRFGVHGVATALILLASIVVAFVVSGRVPGFSFAVGVLDDVIILQLFLAITAIPALFLAAVVAERRKAHDALRQTEELHRITLMSVGDAVISTDVQGRVNLMNPVAEALTGWRQEEARGKRLGDVLHIINEGTRQEVESPVEQVLREGLVVGLANRTLLLARDGIERPIADAGAPIRDEQNLIIGVVLVFRDQTPERAAAKALQESEERFRRIYEESPVAYQSHDVEGRILDVNPAWLAMLGWSREEVIGRQIDEFLTSAGQSVAAEHFPHFRERGVTRGCELEMRRKEGDHLTVAFDGVFVKDRLGRPCYSHCVLHNITERKRTEERLRQQATLLDAATDSIYVRTLDNTLIYWNEAAARFYDQPHAEALGRKITELINPDPTAFDAAHAILLERGHWSGELKSTSKLGNERVVFCRWTLLRDEQGRPKEILAINTDITQQKQMEAQFLRAQRMESIGSLASGIAHDLNNILSPILMTIPFLRETVDDPESLQMIDTVEDCTQRGADIIKQLLTFARGKPGARALLPVRHILKALDKIVRETFPRNIQSFVNSSEELWPVLGDATQIHQALMNLCVNARDAMPNGGRLSLAVENVYLDEALATLIPEAKIGEYVCVSVTDTGTGISPEHMERIFEPFFTTKEIGKGTGLGLATVLGIVRGHGGFVRVDSRLGQKTTFELYLPASPEAKASVTADTETSPPRGQGELILVVDDETSVRVSLKRTLEKHGYQVLVAGEGTDALALFTRHRDKVRAVVTDMMMPGMDGPKLVQTLRQLDARLPILGMTGLAEREGMKGLADLHLPVLLTKPFAGVKILEALNQTLARQSSAPQACQGEVAPPE